MNFKRVMMILLAALLLPGLALAQTSRATFDVTKNWDEAHSGNPASVSVTLNCFTGLPLTQSQNITHNQGVVFVVTDFASGDLDCTVTEADVDGYSATYNGGDGCEFTSVNDGDADSCQITNTPDPVEVTVYKDWVIEGSGGNALDPEYSILLVCDDEIVGGDDCSTPGLQGGSKSYGYSECYYYSGSWIKELTHTGTGNTDDAEYTAHVIPDWDGDTHCYAEESVWDSSIEADDSDCYYNGMHVLIGGVGEGSDNECTIVNTVFYEGIPTLSQYGMVIMALLMLGVGFVGFRRFV